MVKPKVIVIKKVEQVVRDFIEKHCEVVYFEDLEHPESSLEFMSNLREAEGILGSGLNVDSEFLNQASNLKIVCNTSVGYDNLDIQELTKRSIMATNTPDVLTDTTADTIFGLLLATARRIPELNQLVKNKEWKGKLGEGVYGVDVHHKVLGIIGMGRIGSAIAKRANLGFDMNILYHNRMRNEEAERKYGAEYCELGDLLTRSDYVCIMLPLTPESKYLIGERELKLMKKSAILIVGSRGGIVNELDLSSALENQTILGAGLDVFENEPINPENPLLNLKNVVTLPHIGSATFETRLQMDKLAAENLVKGLQDETPPNLLNSKVPLG